MKVEAAKIASTSSKSAFSLVLLPRQRKSDLLEVEVLQYPALVWYQVLVQYVV